MLLESRVSSTQLRCVFGLKDFRGKNSAREELSLLCVQCELTEFRAELSEFGAELSELSFPSNETCYPIWWAHLAAPIQKCVSSAYSSLSFWLVSGGAQGSSFVATVSCHPAKRKSGPDVAAQIQRSFWWTFRTKTLVRTDVKAPKS